MEAHKSINFEIDNIDILEGEPRGEDLKFFGEDGRDSQFATARIRAFSSGWNRHNYYCSDDVLKRTAPTIFYKPLLYVLDSTGQEFGSHAMPEESRPAGFVMPNSEELVRLGDGRLSLEVVVKIWKRYAPTVMRIFQRDKGKKKVSVEMELFDYCLRDDRSIEMLDFAYMAITILGDQIQEASPGANIEILTFSEELESFRKDAILELSSRYDSIDFTIPKSVKKNCQKGIQLSEEYGKNDATGLSHARYMIKHEKIESKRVKKIYSTFNSDRFETMKTDPPSDNYIIYLLYGGESGEKWISQIYKDMTSLDEKSLNYFEKVTFPYKSKSQANPSLRNWDPPLSLSQMNQIARQADAMIENGKSKESAWRIAISNFKKTHRVKDGRWVKKENMDLDNNRQKESEEKEVNMKKDKNKNSEAEYIEDQDENIENEYSESEFEEELVADELEKNEAMKDGDEIPEDEDSEHDDVEEEDEEEPDKEEDGEKIEEDSPFSDKEFSIDTASIMSVLSDVEEVQSLLESKEIDFAEVIQTLCKKFEQLKNDNIVLSEFKQRIDSRDFEIEVVKTLNEIMDKFETEDKIIDEMREESENYSIENLDEWKNKVKAKAVDEFKVKNQEEDNKSDKERRIGFPWASNRATSESSSIWDKISKNK